MMCPRCGNTNLQDARHELQDFYANVLVWKKCFSCGWRGKPIAQPKPDHEQRAVDGGTVPKFTSEEHRQNWIASVRASKERKREVEMEAQARPHARSLPAVIATAPVSRPVGVSRESISQALAQLEEDASTLRRAIEIIERMQA